MPDALQTALINRQPQLNVLRGAQTIQAAPPGDIDPAELMRGEIPLPGEGIARLGDAAASARDLLKGGDIMDKMYAEANPGFRKMQEQGMFSGDRTVHAVPEHLQPDPDARGIRDPEFVKWMQEQYARIPSMKDLFAQLGPAAKEAEPYAQANRWPKEGGVLHEVLNRAAQKAQGGVVNTPGEARLLSHYSDVTRGILPKPLTAPASVGPTVANADQKLMELLATR